MGVKDDIQNTWPAKYLGSEHFSESDIIELTITKYTMEPNFQGDIVPTLYFKEIPAKWHPNKGSLEQICENLGTDDGEAWFGHKISVLGEIKYRGGQEQCWKSVVPKKKPKDVVKETYEKQGNPNAKKEAQVPLEEDDIPF